MHRPRDFSEAMMSPSKPITFAAPLFPYDRWGGIEPLAEAAKHAEELGFDALQFPEHIIMPVRPDVPPVSATWYDNFVLAAHIATLTSRIRLIFSVMIVPYRNPVVAAKLISTLDVVSKGRLTVGVGAGWLKGEFRTLGLPYDERGDMTDEYLRAMKVLWTQETPEFNGKYTTFSRIAFLPKCVQEPHVPLWIGGTGPRPFRRVAELGDGWVPMVGTLDEHKEQIQRVKGEVKAAGRDPEAIDFAYGISFGERDQASETARAHASRGHGEAKLQGATSADEVIDLIGRHREVGFNHLGVNFKWETPSEYLTQLEWFAANVMPKVG